MSLPRPEGSLANGCASIVRPPLGVKIVRPSDVKLSPEGGTAAPAAQMMARDCNTKIDPTRIAERINRARCVQAELSTRAPTAPNEPNKGCLLRCLDSSVRLAVLERL
eukprot:6256428-Prymnesium_polylepis.2